MKFISLHLENFQAYKNTTINFTSGLNIITGESDMGKSSIFRALLKLVRDTPAGKNFINKDATSMKLSLTGINDNGQKFTIVRQITPTKNLYFLNDQEFGGFGREIPKEIQNALEMFLVQLQNNEKIDLHFSDQYDVPFMVSKSAAGTRSKLLGRIAGLHTLDRGIVAVNADIRAGNSALKIKLIDKDRLQKAVETAIDTAEYHKLYDTNKNSLKEIEQKFITVEKLQDLQKKFLEIVKIGKETRKFLDSFPEITADFSEIRKNIQLLNKLQGLYKDLNSIEEQIVKLPKITADIDIDFNLLRKDIQKLNRLQELYTTIISTEDQIKKLENIQFDEDIAKAKKEWTTALAALKICPICKQSTTHIGEYCGQKEN